MSNYYINRVASNEYNEKTRSRKSLRESWIYDFISWGKSIKFAVKTNVKYSVILIRKWNYVGRSQVAKCNKHVNVTGYYIIIMHNYTFAMWLCDSSGLRNRILLVYLNDFRLHSKYHVAKWTNRFCTTFEIYFTKLHTFCRVFSHFWSLKYADVPFWKILVYDESE